LRLIVNFAPTGAVASAQEHPALPTTPARVVEEVLAAAQLGITVAHVHVRDGEGRPCLRPELYAEVLEGIRRHRPDVVVCVSLSGRFTASLEERASPLRQLTGSLKPDMASLTLSSLNFSRQASINAPDTVRFLLAEMRATGVVPEFEAFDLGMVNVLRYLVRKGETAAPLYVNLLLGNVAGAQAELLHAGLLVRELPADALWAFAGLGEQQLRANALGIAAGGGVRVGLEDNLYWDAARSRPATNLELLRRVLELARLQGREPMTPAEFRQRMQMAPGGGEYGRPPVRAPRGP
jgi:uncharacterized protein (DUF849 family)